MNIRLIPIYSNAESDSNTILGWTMNSSLSLILDPYINYKLNFRSIDKEVSPLTFPSISLSSLLNLPSDHRIAPCPFASLSKSHSPLSLSNSSLSFIRWNINPTLSTLLKQKDQPFSMVFEPNSLSSLSLSSLSYIDWPLTESAHLPMPSLTMIAAPSLSIPRSFSPKLLSSSQSSLSLPHFERNLVAHSQLAGFIYYKIDLPTHSSYQSIYLSLLDNYPAFIIPQLSSLSIRYSNIKDRNLDYTYLPFDPFSNKLSNNADSSSNLLTKIDYSPILSHQSFSESNPLNSFSSLNLHFNLLNSLSNPSSSLSSILITLPYSLTLLPSHLYPTDISRGFDLGPAAIKFYHTTKPVPPSPSSSHIEIDQLINESPIYLYSSPSLIPLMFPDQSISFNVIAITSTLLAFVIGALFNLSWRGRWKLIRLQI
jgi:hypothetical protein